MDAKRRMRLFADVKSIHNNNPELTPRIPNCRDKFLKGSKWLVGTCTCNTKIHLYYLFWTRVAFLKNCEVAIFIIQF